MQQQEAHSLSEQIAKHISEQIIRVNWLKANASRNSELHRNLTSVGDQSVKPCSCLNVPS